jgi:hypothetical protein
VDLTYSELNGNREEVDADRLCDLLAARNTGQVDVAGLDEALLALDSLQDLLCKSTRIVSLSH